ncbi:hypothetical protein [Cellulosimicrobium cellulans]|uniref:hypothetical protein n=1 Tax=Cellulosimicrobium cellulans TaxID=1710 RepID=UPI0005B85E75|nr:hypothetical protein [Cellulosimicrobium cellulans]
MDVLTAAWIASGWPIVDEASLGAGECARCDASAHLVPVRRAVSKSFTAYDAWSNPSGPGLCQACTWAYTTTSLRAQAHLVGRSPATVRPVPRSGAAELLLTGALSADDALFVPLRPGRKHVLPAAEWGRVAVDDVTIPWSASDASLLRRVLDLRDRGFGTRMIAEPAPPYAVLIGLDRSEWPAVLQAWRELAPWRSPDNPWLHLALHITTPDPAKEA